MLDVAGEYTGGDFNMTALALTGSRHHNGVSRLHGEVSSAICEPHWPQIPPEENPMSYVTNGVHLPTFLQNRWDDLLDRTLGAEWRLRPTDANGGTLNPGHVACTPVTNIKRKGLKRNVYGRRGRVRRLFICRRM